MVKINITAVTPSIEIRNEEKLVLIRYGSHTFIIDVKANAVYLDGKPIENYTGTSYKKRFVKEHNIAPVSHEHKNVCELFFKGSVLQFNRGKDGRLFWNYWDNWKKKRVWRYPPCWKVSYWDDKFSGEKRLYIENLKEPAYVWDKKIEEFEKVGLFKYC